MKLLIATALLGLGITAAAAQPAAFSWPPNTCLHGTTVNDSGRPLNLRALEGTIRQLLQDAGATISSPRCSGYVNVLVYAETLSGQTTRITAHLVMAEREVTLDEVGRNAASFACKRTVTEKSRAQEDFFLSAQSAVTRLLSQPPSCLR